MNYDIARIKDEIKLPIVIRKLGGELTHDREDFMMQCMFHNEKSGSLHIYDGATRFHCFGCGAAGDVIDFYQQFVGCDSAEAIKAVAGFAGLAPENENALRPPATKKVSGSAIEYEPEKKEVVKLCDASDLVNGIVPQDISEMMDRKGISLNVLAKLASENVLNVSSGGKLLYFYPDGVKVRNDPASSRGDRWLAGKARGAIWRGQQLELPLVDDVYITEGETDLMALMTHRPEGITEGYIAIAGASMGISAVDAYRIGFDRKVSLLFDNDEAGRKATDACIEVFHKEVTGCDLYKLDWDRIKGDANDIGDLPPITIKNIDGYLVSC